MGKGPVKVEVIIEVQECTTDVEIPRDEWDALTPVQRLRTIESAAIEEVNNAGGWGWHIADPDDAAMVGDPVPASTQVLALMDMITAYGEACMCNASAVLPVDLDKIRAALEELAAD